jgi:hypothetical protein
MLILTGFQKLSGLEIKESGTPNLLNAWQNMFWDMFCHATIF